jgi:ABC-type transporter Mla MlaB component
MAIMKYYMHDGPHAFRFELSGDLNRDAAIEIEQAWRTASSVIGDRMLIVDMTFVIDADATGRTLLARWHREGARLIAGSETARALAESIIGEPLPQSQQDSRCTPTSHRTWRPFLALSASVLVASGLLIFPARANAAPGGVDQSSARAFSQFGPQNTVLERETGLESATSGLGIWKWIEMGPVNGLRALWLTPVRFLGVARQ